MHYEFSISMYESLLCFGMAANQWFIVSFSKVALWLCLSSSFSPKTVKSSPSRAETPCGSIIVKHVQPVMLREVGRTICWVAMLRMPYLFACGSQVVSENISFGANGLVHPCAVLVLESIGPTPAVAQMETCIMSSRGLCSDAERSFGFE